MTTKHLELAHAYLEGKELETQPLKDLLKALMGSNSFAMARQVLDKAAAKPAGQWGEKMMLWMQQQRALCTYKDTERPPEERFSEALEILEKIGLCADDNAHYETLGLGGAIYKRMWEFDGNYAHIQSALSLYRAGWERDKNHGKGYCGVNAAYLLDLQALLATEASKRVHGDDTQAKCFAEQARCLREDILAFLENLPTAEKENYWHLATVAEIYFGLGSYEKAGEFFQNSIKVASPEEWKSNSTARQLLNLARCQGIYPSANDEEGSRNRRAWEALKPLLGDDAESLLKLNRGKVGLALSGGGFRASFFHLGVLARLAEVDALRHVEVLSTVSGGSILGVHYYLELKQLLESKSDLTITREDYLALVRRVKEDFFQAVSRNLRMRTLANFWVNLKMVFSPAYSRSHRIGELYESEIYARVGDGKGIGGKRIMDDLLIRPAGHDIARQFKPNEENWRRHTKVPILLLNTTSLNSGHNFHFTANWMGEPPGLTGAEVDMNVRYRRLYYKDAPTADLRCFRVGYAVAASSCVPLLFEPLVLKNLYPGRTIRLVDGGVHDNQGVNGLLDESCDFILCSDASGQMHDESVPGSNALGILMRSDSILQDRVREAQYQDLVTREKSGACKGLFFVHLKKDLRQETLSESGCKQNAIPAPQPNQTPYGIDRDIQRRLSELRTDLDAFTEVEAQSLMMSGYLMTDLNLRDLDREHRRKGREGTWGGYDIEAERGNWAFLKLAPIAAKPADSPDLRRRDLEKQLKVGSQITFKAYQLIPWLKTVGIGALVLLAATLVWAITTHWSSTFVFPPLRVGAMLIAAVILLAGFMVPFAKYLNPQKASRNFLIKLGIALLGAVVANLHLYLIGPLFRRRGSVERLCHLPEEKE